MLVEEKEVAKTLNDTKKMEENAQQTTAFLKSIAHTGRLLILCKLSEKPSDVGELEKSLGMHQAAVSKQLARLREEGLVKADRNGRFITYSIADVRARIIIDTLYDVFCSESHLQ